MNFLDALIDTTGNEAISHRIYGVVIGIVTNNKDPEKLGRVKVNFPWLNDKDESTWARIALPMAGKERGMFFLPEVDDEVLVVFEQGDMRFPYIIGALWNAEDKPPASNDDGKNNIRFIKSRSGHIIRLDDTEQSEKIEIIDKSGKNQIVFDTANNAITITSDKDITLSASKGTIKLDAQKIEVNASADIKIAAKTTVDMEATATMNIKGKPINLN